MRVLVPVTLFAAVVAAALPVLAADHRLEPLDETAPADAVSAEILGQLSPTGLRVVRGKSRVVCDLWLSAVWPAKSDFEASSTVIYPFEVGQLMGVARYKSKSTDFRGQSIAPGVYVIRYGLQPVDGNHVGTSEIRDFLLLTPAAEDQAVAPIEEKALFKLSAKSVGAKHPAMLCLLRPDGQTEGLPTLAHDEEHDLWSVRTAGKAAAGDTTHDVVLDVVVVGEGKH
jgi:hypothetical protein